MADSGFHYVAGDNSEPLHSAQLDVVFVHGLAGHHKATWTHECGTYWPHLLAKQFPNINVYSLDYDSSFLANFLKGGGATLADRATILMDQLSSRRTPDKPLLFITHSLGGLIVKQALRKCSDSGNEKNKRVSKQTIGVFFIATPHHGAKLATTISAIIKSVSKTVEELNYSAEPLIELASWFSNWANTKKIKVESYYELENTYSALIVDKVSANPNVLECDPIAVQSDHINITKLSDSENQLYKSVSTKLKDILEEMSLSEVSQLQTEFQTYTTSADKDRRTLAQKLTSAGRKYEIERAERKKEEFSMLVNRNITQPSAVQKFTHIMSSIETRFHRHVKSAISGGKASAEIDDLIQQKVLDPSVKAHSANGQDVTDGLAESAFYYLAGNCHIGWDNE